jgi:hypothetical protein
MRPFVRNHYLPLWLHRICNGIFPAVILLGLGSIWFTEPAGTWRHFISLCLMWGSIPVGVIFACLTHRFSVVEGTAGDAGYENLDEKPGEKSQNNTR